MNTPTYNQYCLQSLDASNTFQHSGESYPAKARKTAMNLFSTLDDLDPTKFNKHITIYSWLGKPAKEYIFIGLYTRSIILTLGGRKDRLFVVYQRKGHLYNDYRALNIYGNTTNKAKEENGNIYIELYEGDRYYWIKTKKQITNEQNLISFERSTGVLTIKAHPLLCLFYAVYIQEQKNDPVVSVAIPCKNYGVMIANILIFCKDNYIHATQIKKFIQYFLEFSIPIFKEYGKNKEKWVKNLQEPFKQKYVNTPWECLPYIFLNNDSKDVIELKIKKYNKLKNYYPSIGKDIITKLPVKNIDQSLKDFKLIAIPRIGRYEDGRRYFDYSNYVYTYSITYDAIIKKLLKYLSQK